MSLRDAVLRWFRPSHDGGGDDDRPPEQESALPAVRSDAELLAQLSEFEAQIAPRVPAAVSSRVARVVAVVRDTIPRLGQLGAGSYQAHSVIATATSYLPEAVGGYLRLPRGWADTRPISGGRTALMVLCDQLDLLGTTMDKVRDAVLRADAAALVAHGAFLQEKFGTGGGLDLGPGASAAVPPPAGEALSPGSLSPLRPPDAR